MSKEAKTNALRFLEKCGIPYESRAYECKEFIDGKTVALMLGLPADETYKTLVAVGKSGEHYCFLLPVGEELDLKKAAASVGEKSAELIPVRDITKVTGYVRGGCTPIGMKKQFMTVVDSSAEKLGMFYISGGRIGLQIRVSPKRLIEAIGGKFADITEKPAG